MTDDIKTVITKVLELDEKATDGEWGVHSGVVVVCDDYGITECFEDAGFTSKSDARNNATLIAYYRTAAPLLARECQRLAEHNGRLFNSLRQEQEQSERKAQQRATTLSGKYRRGRCDAVAELGHPCTCGSGAHPRECKRHTWAFAAHVEAWNEMDGPTLKDESNTAGDSCEVCSECGTELNEPHSWKECAKVQVCNARAECGVELGHYREENARLLERLSSAELLVAEAARGALNCERDEWFGHLAEHQKKMGIRAMKHD